MHCLSIIVSLSLVVTISSQVCPDGWRASQVFPNKCYYVASQKRIWFDAEAYCQNAQPNAHLTTIGSAFENSNVDAIVLSTSAASNCHQFWIGANDIDQTGQFAWMDGSPWGYANWASGQPHLTKQCVSSTARTKGQWKTERCGIENCFICEMDMGERTSPPLTTTPSTTTSTQASVVNSSSTSPYLAFSPSKFVPSINCTNYGIPLGGQCVCPSEFTGPNCQFPVCRNGGSCVIVNDTSGYCNCSVGYAGKNCLNFECTQNMTSPFGAVTNVSLGIVLLNSASMAGDAADSIMQGMDSFFNYADANYPGYYQNFVVTKFNSTASPTDLYTNRYLAWRDMQISADPDTACNAQQTLLALNNTISHPAFVPGSQVFVFTNALFGDASNIDALQKLISQKRPKLMFFIIADSGDCSDELLSNPDAMTVYRQLAAITGGFAARVSKTDFQPLIQSMAPISYQAQTMSQMDVDDCRIATKETLILSRFGQTSFAINVIAIGQLPMVIVQDIITNQNTTYRTPDVTNYEFNLFQLTILKGLHSVYFSTLYIPAAEPCQFRMFESSNYQIDYGFTDDPKDDLTSTYPIFDPLSNSGSITLSVYSSSAAETAGASNYVYTTTSSGRGSCGYETYFKYPWTCLAPGQFFFMRFVNSFNGNFFIRSAVTQCRKDSEQLQCLNGGTPNGATCTCTAGLWSGTYCEIPICYNGGSATAENLMYCACPLTISGAHCENSSVVCS